MRANPRLWIGFILMAACALGVAGLMAPALTAAPPGQFCGGIAGIPCPEGFVCVDVPGDRCDPDQGGADCPGRCRRSH